VINLEVAKKQRPCSLVVLQAQYCYVPNVYH